MGQGNVVTSELKRGPEGMSSKYRSWHRTNNAILLVFFFFRPMVALSGTATPAFAAWKWHLVVVAEASGRCNRFSASRIVPLFGINTMSVNSRILFGIQINLSFSWGGSSSLWRLSARAYNVRAALKSLSNGRN